MKAWGTNTCKQYDNIGHESNVNVVNKDDFTLKCLKKVLIERAQRKYI